LLNINHAIVSQNLNSNKLWRLHVLLSTKMKNKKFKQIKIMKHLKISEARLVRSDYFAVLISMLAAALVLLPFFTSAKGRETAKVGQVYMYSMNGSRAAVTLTNLSEGKYTLSIESQNGVEVFYNERIDSPEKFAKIFDFSRLEDGDYNIIVKVDNVTKAKHFEIKNGEVIVKPELSVVPSFKAQGTKALIEIPNANSQLVSIRIYSPDGDELYSGIEKQDVRKFFDFKNVENGKYTVYVMLDNASYKFDYTKE
jgi:hypothetical protein